MVLLNETEIVNSTLIQIQNKSFLNLFNELNMLASSALRTVIPETYITSIFIKNPLLILSTIFFILMIFAIFVDFIEDAWKIPLAILIDIVDLISLWSGIFTNILAAISSLLLFFLLARDCPKSLYYSFAIIAMIKAILPVPFLATIPICTIFMFIATIADR